MTTGPTTISESLQPREMRVAKSTYFVIGFVAAMPLFLGVGGVAGNDKILGIIGLISAPLIFWYFCFQKISISDGLMTYRRPLFPEQRVLLSSITQVRTDWGKGGGYRRLLFISGETTLCAFNPKLFSLEDLAFMIKAVSTFAPTASIDEDAQALHP